MKTVAGATIQPYLEADIHPEYGLTILIVDGSSYHDFGLMQLEPLGKALQNQ